MEKRSIEPAGFSTDTKAFWVPLKVVCGAPTLVGKSAAVVSPVTYAFPPETAIPVPWLNPVPPITVTYCTVGVRGAEVGKLSLATKASSHDVVLGGVPQVFRGRVVPSKIVDIVEPVT